MLTILLPLLFITAGASLLALLLKRRFEQTLPVYCMGSALLIYLLGFLGQMSLGFTLLMLFSALCPAYIIIQKLIKKQSFRETLRPILTPGFAVFLVLYAVLAIWNIGHQLSTWDSLSHWGPMVQETFRLGDFYNSSGSILAVHADYPPIITIYETIFCKFAGGISDQTLYLALQIFGLSFFLPFLSGLDWQKPKKLAHLAVLALLILVAPLLVYMAEANFYSSIYIDAVLAILLAFGFALITISKKRDKFFIATLALLFTFFILTKQISIVFVLLLLTYLIILLIVEYRHRLKNSLRAHYKSIILSTIALLGLPLACLLLWNSRIASLGITGQFSIGAIVGDTVSTLTTHTLAPWQAETFTNFISQFFTPSHLGNLVSFSYFQMLLLFPVLICLVCRLTGISPARRRTLIAISILGGLGYAVLMLLLYMFAFGPVEGPALASYTRYTNTYWLALAMALVMIFLHAYLAGSIRRPAIRPTHILVSVILILTIWLGSDAYFWLLRRPNTSARYSADTSAITARVPSDSSVFVVNIGQNGYDTFALQYLLSPIRVNVGVFSVTASASASADPGRPAALMSPGEFLALTQDYAYLYLLHIDDQFITDYSALFASTPTAGQLYQFTGSQFTPLD